MAGTAGTRTKVAAAIAVVGMLALGAASTAAAAPADAGSRQTTVSQHHPTGTPAPTPPPGFQGTRTKAASDTSASASARHANEAGDEHYFGGRVISNVQVVPVLWGPSPPTGPHLPEVNDQATPNIDTFYTAIVDSPYLDWLNEYGTNRPAVDGGPGSGQTIGRGTLGARAQVYPDVPLVVCNALYNQVANEFCMDDDDVRAALVAQLAAHALPAPITDAAGNVDTVYSVFLPRHLSVTYGDYVSGIDFCTYHSTIAATADHPEIYYDVLPDNGPGTLMDTNCNDQDTAFEDLTTMASTLLLDTITDPEIGAAEFSDQRPTAWYWNDPDFPAEVGDLCSWQDSVEISGPDGQFYAVAPGYSEVLNDCVVRPGGRVAIGVTPATSSIHPGETVVVTVTTTTLVGAPAALTLTADAFDPGITATLSKQSVTSGESVTMTVTVSPATAPNVAPEMFDIEVDGVGDDHTSTDSGFFDFDVVIGPQWRVCSLTTICPNGIGEMMNTHITVPGSLSCRANTPSAMVLGGIGVPIVDGYVLADTANDEAFAEGIDGHVYHSYQTSPAGGAITPWSSLGGPPVGIYGAVRTGTNYVGNQELYVRSNNGAVYHLYATPGRGSGWQGWDTMGAPSVGIAGDVWEGTNFLHNQEVYVLGKDGNVYHKFSTPGVGSGWSNWDPMGHPSGVMSVGDVHIGINSACNQELYLTGTDGNTYHSYSTPGQGSGWSAWSSLGQPSPGVASDVAIGQNFSGNQEMFVVAKNNTVYHDYATPGSGTGWSGWSSLDAPPGTIISTMVWVDTYPSETLTVATTAGLYNKTTTGNGWGPWTKVPFN